MERYFQLEGFATGDKVRIVREGKDDVVGTLSHITSGSDDEKDQYAQSYVLTDFQTGENIMIESGPDAMKAYTFVSITKEAA